MPRDAHVYEELSNIVRHAPVFPGNTLSHATANECVARGWAQRDVNGDFIPTSTGKSALEAWLEVDDA